MTCGQVVHKKYNKVYNKYNNDRVHDVPAQNSRRACIECMTRAERPAAALDAPADQLEHCHHAAHKAVWKGVSPLLRKQGLYAAASCFCTEPAAPAEVLPVPG
jgi:hypothetical protein